MKHIFYDHQIFSSQKVGGISRYFSELKKDIKQYGFNLNESAYYTDNIYYDQKIPLLNKARYRGQERIQKLTNSLIDYFAFSASKYDIIHPTYYNASNYLKEARSKKVITVYDMIHEKFPQYFKDSLVLSENKKNLTQSSDIVIAISNRTKQDLINLFDIPPEKIRVIYLASSLNSTSKSTSTKLPERYILFVGSRKNYKNFNDFINSAANIIRASRVSILCVGGGEFTANENEGFAQLGLQSFMHQKDLSDSQLVYAYQNALLFTFPSLYEGFGLPILEAFEFSCPTLLLNASCFPEIAQEGAHYFTNFEELPIILERLINDDKFRKSKSHLQQLRAKDFSWKETAKQTATTYNGLI